MFPFFVRWKWFSEYLFLLMDCSIWNLGVPYTYTASTTFLCGYKSRANCIKLLIPFTSFQGKFLLIRKLFPGLLYISSLFWSVENDTFFSLVVSKAAKHTGCIHECLFFEKLSMLKWLHTHHLNSTTLSKILMNIYLQSNNMMKL